MGRIRTIMMMRLPQHARSSNICAATLLLFALASCAQQPTRSENTDIYEHSTHRLAQPPQAAASCVARNAGNAGYAGLLQPLFGTAAVAVSVRDGGPTGNTIATISMLPEGTGSRATVTSAREGLRDRKALLDTVLARC